MATWAFAPGWKASQLAHETADIPQCQPKWAPTQSAQSEHTTQPANKSRQVKYTGTMPFYIEPKSLSTNLKCLQQRYSKHVLRMNVQKEHIGYNIKWQSWGTIPPNGPVFHMPQKQLKRPCEEDNLPRGLLSRIHRWLVLGLGRFRGICLRIG